MDFLRQFSLVGSMPLALFPLKFRPEMSFSSPHTGNQHRREHQEAGQTKPALHPMHIGHDGGDLIHEEVGQPEQEWDAERGGARADGDGLSRAELVGRNPLLEVTAAAARRRRPAGERPAANGRSKG